MKTKLHISCVALIALSCSQSDGTGGITASIVFQDLDQSRGVLRQGLRTAAVPRQIDRLQIFAMDVSGSTVAETNLVASPGPGDVQLQYDGGTWELTRVPAGEGYTLVGNAFLGQNADPRLNQGIALTGRVEGITVAAGQVQDIGILELASTGLRVPGLDNTPPSAPNPISASTLPEGGALRITVGKPIEPDVVGYVLAVTTSTLTQTPTIAQGLRLNMGDQLAPGLTVVAAGDFSAPVIFDLLGLTDNEGYTILGYAFDGDIDGNPLNYSQAASTFATPVDTLPPGTPGGLAVVTAGNLGVDISFVEPGEDGNNSGPVMAYELRVALDPIDLTNPDNFENQPVIRPPLVTQTGTTSTFRRTFAELGVVGSAPFFVGLRAVDASSNVGPIAVAGFTPNIDQPPDVVSVDQVFGLTNSIITIRGLLFGPTAGMVSITATLTGTVTQEYPLMVTQWENERITAQLPPDARSGALTVTRPDAEQDAIFLPVIAALPDELDDFPTPFELAGAPGNNTATFYRESANLEGALERLNDGINEDTPRVPFMGGARSTSITGTYHPVYDLFMFVASNDTLSMTSAFVTSSSVTPAATRLTPGVAAGGADRVSIVLLDGGQNGQYPGMVAFSRDGSIRTASVADVQVQPFNAFTLLSPATATVAFDQVTIQKDDQTGILMAHRAVDQMTGEASLILRTGDSSTTAFTLVDAINPPRVGQNFEILSVPTTPGGPQIYVIAYEAIEPDGRTEIRLLTLQDYDALPGLAPFATIAEDRRLDDVGIIIRNGQVWIAVAAARVDAGAGLATLSYTEVPVSEVLIPDNPPGRYPGLELDTAPDDTSARLGCKPLAMGTCAIGWVGSGASVLFYRR